MMLLTSTVLEHTPDASSGYFTAYSDDPLGNAVQSVSSSGTLSSPQYPISAWGTLGNRAYSSGYYGLAHNFNVGWNQTNGLLGLGARLYDPQTGRFINRDPMGYAYNSRERGTVAGDSDGTTHDGPPGPAR